MITGYEEVERTPSPERPKSTEKKGLAAIAG